MMGVIQCPRCDKPMICESFSTEGIWSYRLKCPAGHIWNLVEVKDEPRRLIDTCIFCGKPLYDGDDADDWTNYLPKEIVIKKGQDASDAYMQRICRAICPNCERVHPTSRHQHDGIIWARLKEEYKK